MDIKEIFSGVEGFENVSPAILWAMLIVACLICLVFVVSIVIAIWLGIKYHVYNKRQNSANVTGGDAARQILDKNGLEHIKVSSWGSFLFGNSYSHFFKKVRLRRLTKDKSTITSLAMGAEKSALAIMDKEGDPDMKHRIALTPFIYFGPIAFVPLVLIGVLIDVLVFNFTGVVSLIAAGAGLLFYILSFVLSLKILKTEKKAQVKACEIMVTNGLATPEEVEDMKKLYKLYNIQYVNDLILEFLQMLLKILEIVARVQGKGGSSNN